MQQRALGCGRLPAYGPCERGDEILEQSWQWAAEEELLQAQEEAYE